MRRTYMSKKATVNNIDRRDLFQNLDEKCTPYDAFSIQNIKQTKRELSCIGGMNTLGVASSRVRKKKYVKRIIKDIGKPSGDSMSQSTNLTPDKSIHVNKTPDPFDLLLMSSPINSKKPESQTTKEDLFFNNIKKEGKKYIRRRVVKSIKKYNNSSTDSSESEKENSNERELTQNTSDIRSHKLLVEQDRNISSKLTNDSINNIVNNISLLHKLKQNNSANDSSNKILRKNNHRLTRNSVLLKSPLSSTPFKAKHRKAGESIFKISPIISEDRRDSYLNTDNDNSINSVIHLDISNANSPVVIAENSLESLNLVPNDNIEAKTSKFELSSSKDINKEEEGKGFKPLPIGNADDEVNFDILTNIETSFYQSEIEPFLGFSPKPNVVKIIPNKLQFRKTLYFYDDVKNGNNKNKNDITDCKISKIDESLKESCQSTNYVSLIARIVDEDKESDLEENVINISIAQHTIIENNDQSSRSSESIINDSINSGNFNNRPLHTKLSIQNENLDTSFAGDQHTSIDNYQKIDENLTKEHNTTKDNDLVTEHNFTENINKNDETYESNIENESNDVISDSTSLSESKESLYDTCTSEQSSVELNEVKKEPVVILERMDDSLFYRYYNKNDSNEPEISNNNDDSNSIENSVSDFFSVRGSYANDKSDTDLEIDEENDLFKLYTDDNATIISTDESSSSNNEEEKCISFVTTRRRNEVTNNSIISLFSNSYSSSTDCNETVLSIKKELENSETDDNQNGNSSVIDLDTNAINHVQKSDVTKEAPKKEIITTEIEPSKSVKEDYVRSSNSTILAGNSTSHTEYARTNFDLSRMSVIDNRPGIVLKPGKKWERSLSIFRRMTMMNDHLNQSILDEELTKTKGRNYRQSVISTIEMQDLNGSLHNESINSRRSTFVSKPSRSTIRIVKDLNISRPSLCNTTVFDDLKGFLNEECDDTIIELSKLSIADQSHEVTVLDNFHDTSNRITAARDYVLRRCNQTDTILFDECYPDAVLKNCHKIGEGVYGEVFLWRARDGCARVLKIIPIAGNIKVNGESQKDFHEIISEIVIAMELSALRAPIAEIEQHLDEGKDVETLDLHSIENATDVFNEVLAVRCVYGSYPSRLLDLWDLYDECKGSENDNPAILPVDQQYIVLELANAGQDLESYQFNNAEQAHALFLQVAYGLAVAEEAFQFEHRDLHWGNILISPTDQKYATFVIRGRSVRVPRRGVRGAIIDYSLSRVALRLGCGDAAALYNDLAADDELFDALGDYQFDVYRLMREKLENEWKNFEPYTNILWLHYTVDKMITALRYKRTNTKIHKHYIDKLKGIKARILQYGSAAQFVLTDNEI